MLPLMPSVGGGQSGWVSGPVHDFVESHGNMWLIVSRDGHPPTSQEILMKFLRLIESHRRL